MKIHNGFIKMLSGRWVNLSSIHEFTVVQCLNGEYRIFAFFKDQKLVEQKLDKLEFETEKEAEDYLDFMMGYFLK